MEHAVILIRPQMQLQTVLCHSHTYCLTFMRRPRPTEGCRADDDDDMTFIT